MVFGRPELVRKAASLVALARRAEDSQKAADLIAGSRYLGNGCGAARAGRSGRESPLERDSGLARV